MAAMPSRSAPLSPRQKPDFADLSIAVGCALALTLALLFLAMVPLVRHLAGGRDYVVYWATGQQLAHHGDPFDPAAMGRLEHAAGYEGKGSYYMRNPPWSLPLAWPLGYLGARAAALPWSLAIAALLVMAGRMLWTSLGRPQGHLLWLAYSFPPALQCIVMGQTSIFPLFGLALFLCLHRRRPFAAGAALWLCSLKPHLFLPWGVALIAWIVVSRNYRIALGALTAMAVSCSVTEWLDPQAWSQYLHWAGHSGIGHEYIPCLGIAFRNLVNPGAEWLAFVPAALACTGSLVYFWRRRNVWDWMDQGGLLILVSIVVAPYCWFYDQSLAVPALLFAAARKPSRPVLAILGLLYLAVALQPYLFRIGLNSKLFLWTAPAWLTWFLLARWSAARQSQSGGLPDPAVSG